MKRSVNENIIRLRSLMGILNEENEDVNSNKEEDEIKNPYYGPNAIYAKIPFNHKYGKNAYQLQSNQDYSFDDGYTYYLLPSKIEYGSLGSFDPNLGNNADIFNYGETTNDGRTVLGGTYTLLKVKDNSEIFEGKPFNVKGSPLKPETGSWTELINDAKSWTIDLFFEGKDSTLKSIYSDTSNFLNPTEKILTYQDKEPAGWILTDVGNISNVDRFKNIPEVTTSTEYILDITTDGKMTFFIRNPRLTRLIPIWDGKQLTFKKSNGSEKNGEIIVTSSSDISKVEESKFRYEKTLLFEKSEKTGCIEGDCQNGKGTMTWSNGGKYVGNWKNGERNGYGTYTFSDGRKYVGNFKDDVKNGYGTFTWTDGDKYVGNWKDDDFNGYGTYTFSDGSKYVGNWKDGNYNGYGTFTYSYGSKYVGNWKDDDFNGYGTYTYSDGRKYVGNWKNGERNGYGTYTFSDGRKYVGNFKDDVKNGYGTFTYSDGRKYVGNWKDGYFNGYGTYTNSSGCKYSGEWIMDVLNGKSMGDYNEITNCTEKTKEKPKENEVKVDNTIIDEKLNFSADFGIDANDIYYDLVKGKIPNVSIVSIVEEPTKNSNNEITTVILKIKIGSTKYRATFNQDGLKLQNDSNDNHVVAVWNNRDLTTRPTTAAEKKRIKSDKRLEYWVDVLGGDKFIMEETLKRFKQLIK